MVDGSIVSGQKDATGRLQDVLIRCSSLTLKCKEQLKTYHMDPIIVYRQQIWTFVNISFSSSGKEVRIINDMFRPQDLSLLVFHVFALTTCCERNLY
jgi:hypothetical protein